MVLRIWVNIGSGIDLLHDDTKPLPEPKLSNHQWSLMALTWGQFHRKCPMCFILMVYCKTAIDGYWWFIARLQLMVIDARLQLMVVDGLLQDCNWWLLMQDCNWWLLMVYCKTAIDGSVQDCKTANAPELMQPCIKPSIWVWKPNLKNFFYMPQGPMTSSVLIQWLSIVMLPNVT